MHQKSIDWRGTYIVMASITSFRTRVHHIIDIECIFFVHSLLYLLRIAITRISVQPSLLFKFILTTTTMTIESGTNRVGVCVYYCVYVLLESCVSTAMSANSCGCVVILIFHVYYFYCAFRASRLNTKPNRKKMYIKTHKHAKTLSHCKCDGRIFNEIKPNLRAKRKKWSGNVLEHLKLLLKFMECCDIWSSKKFVDIIMWTYFLHWTRSKTRLLIDGGTPLLATCGRIG